MTAFQWESLSNQGVATAGVLYFLALLAHLVEWSSLRHVAGESRRRRSGSAAASSSAPRRRRGRGRRWGRGCRR